MVSGDNNNYGDFLLKAIEAAKDQFTSDELKILNDGAGQIREIEEKLMALEEKYPDCVKMPGEGEMLRQEMLGAVRKSSRTFRERISMARR